MRVCLHTLWPIDRYFVGGTERFLVDSAKSLRKFGFEVFVLCSNTTPLMEIEGIPIVGNIPEKFASSLGPNNNDPRALVANELYSQPASMASVEKLSEYVQEQLGSVEFDIVHLNTFSGSLFREPPRQAVLTIHENPQELDRFWHNGSFEKLSHLVRDDEFSPPKCIFAPTEYYAKKYSEMLDRPVVCNPIGVPWTNIDSLPDRNAQSERRILLPARLYPQQKGQDLLIDALGILQNRGIDFFATLTGADERYVAEARALYEQIDMLGLRHQVTIKRSNSILDEFSSHDVLVSPERYCSYGISVREAAAMGLKLVISDIPPHQELHADRLKVFCFERDNASACAAAIENALASERAPITEHIRFRLTNDFDAFSKVYAKIYLDLLCES